MSQIMNSDNRDSAVKRVEFSTALMKKIVAFAKEVQPIFNFAKWEWTDKGVPTVEDIVENLKEKIVYVLESENHLGTSSGRLYVNRDIEMKEQIEFGLDSNGGFFWEDEARISPRSTTKSTLPKDETGEPIK